MSQKHACFVTLPGRGAVTVSGPDRRGFLQGLITNDVMLLDRQPVIYACLLTAQGKFQHDFFITEQGVTITLECEGAARAQDLYAILKKFRLRASVTLECFENIDIFAVMPAPDYNTAMPTADPRNPALGSRQRQRPDLPEHPFAIWDSHRIALGIPDGSRDMVPGTSTMAEARIDQLNGISWSKGCYTGQELTARMHYRGLAKKHLVAVRSIDDSPVPPPGTDLLGADGHLIGEMRSGCGTTGIALIKDDRHDALPEAGLTSYAS